MIMIKAQIAQDKVFIWDRNAAKNIFENDYYGRLREDRLELSLVEAAFLYKKKKITIYNNNKKMGFNEFFDYCCSIDNRFRERFIVYTDLRNKSYPTRTGFKFGCDFRVYNKGVKPLKRGPKSAAEHTKWIVFAVPKNYSCGFQELSRAVRLAHNIRAHMLWALVDKDDKVVYFEIVRITP